MISVAQRNRLVRKGLTPLAEGSGRSTAKASRVLLVSVPLLYVPMIPRVRASEKDWQRQGEKDRGERGILDSAY